MVVEYGIWLCCDLIVNSGDFKGYYSCYIIDCLLCVVECCQYQLQVVLLVDFVLDVSVLLSYGEVVQVGCIGILIENIYGFEIVLEEGIEVCWWMLVEFFV